MDDAAVGKNHSHPLLKGLIGTKNPQSPGPFLPKGERGADSCGFVRQSRTKPHKKGGLLPTLSWARFLVPVGRGMEGLFFVVLVVLLLMAAAPLQDGYTLLVHKTNGFNNGSQIRGAFSAEVVGDMTGVQVVQFLADGAVFGEASEAPFKIGFRTTDFSDGWHTFSARVQMTDGRSLTTGEKRFEFVSAEAEAAFFRTFVLPMLGGVLLLIASIAGAQFLAMRSHKLSDLPLGAERKFGLKGGGVCPQCKRAFSLHWWSANLVTSAYDRCDYCGKWSMVGFASRAELQAAIAAELADAQPIQPSPAKSPDDQLKERLDDSRFSD
jgi:hypothetical protein